MGHDPELLESAWLKWSWAVSHTERLKADFRTWRLDPDREGDVGLGRRYDAKHHRIDVFVASINPFPVEWGLAVGDIAHNYRSCLDHIAWALVERGRTPPDTLSKRLRRKIAFPIFDGRVSFNDCLDRMLPGVGRTDRAVVRAYQPYQAPKRVRHRHVLLVLYELSNHDKHRTVQPVGTAPRAMFYDVRSTSDSLMTRVPGGFRVSEPLKIGTQLAPIYVRKTGPNPDADVHGQLSVEPALQQGVMMGNGWTQHRSSSVGS